MMMEPISTVLVEDRVVVPAHNDANSLYQDGYGSLLTEERPLTLNAFEALYLVERRRIAVVDETTRRRLLFQELLSRLSKDDPDTWTRYIVYRDLRERGFVARAGRDSNADLLVYERGMYGKRPPKYQIYTLWEGLRTPISRLGEVLDSAVEEERILRLAVVDRRGEVVYYTLSEMDFEKLS